MKKFKKKKKKHILNDIAALFYWGAKVRLIAASWDSNVRTYDDSSAEAEGSKQYTLKKHKEPVNFIDFKYSLALCASCSDDRQVIIYNYLSYR